MDAPQEGSKQSCQQLISGVGADKGPGKGKMQWYCSHFETPDSKPTLILSLGGLIFLHALLLWKAAVTVLDSNQQKKV